MVAHVAAAPGDLTLAAATLDWTSLSLGYPDRHSYMRWHQLQLLYGWLGNGSYTLQKLLEVRALIAPTADGEHDTQAFLSSCAGVLTGYLVLGQREEELQLLAELLHLPVSARLCCSGLRLHSSTDSWGWHAKSLM